MLKHRKQFATATMSRVLSVSRSGFYAWLSRHHRPSQLRHRQQKIDMHVANAFKADKSRSGAIRVMLALEKPENGRVKPATTRVTGESRP